MERLLRKQNSSILRVNGVSCDPPIAVLSLGKGIPNVEEGVNVNLPAGGGFTSIANGGNSNPQKHYFLGNALATLPLKPRKQCFVPFRTGRASQDRCHVVTERVLLIPKGGAYD